MSLNYVMLCSNNVTKAKLYYDAVLPLMGGAVVSDYMPQAIGYGLRGGGRIWVTTPYNKEAATPGNGSMVGLLCESKDEVIAVHAAALANGGSNEGDPGPRPQYGPDFFGAYVRDPDGNKMSFVYWSGSV